MPEQLTKADEAAYALVDLWEELDLVAEPPCEASEKRHEGRECSGSAEYALRTCLIRELVCETVADVVRRRMAAGGKCRQHDVPLVEGWRLIPV